MKMKLSKVQFGESQREYGPGELRFDTYPDNEVHLLLDTNRDRAGRIRVALSPAEVLQLIKNLADSLGEALIEKKQ